MDSMAEKIKALRLRLDLTLEDVGEAVGVSKSTVRKWETGQIANMRRDKIAALAKALHTTPAYLMGWEDTPEPEPELTFDDFTYALYNETANLTDENKAKLLEMAKFFQMQQDKEEMGK